MTGSKQEETAQAYWDGLARAAKEESGGGGLISHATVETGFKAFATGVGQSESWFPAQHSDKAGRATAKRAAKTLADEYGCKYAWGVAIVTPKDKTYKGGEVCTWSVETMVRFSPSYSSAYSEIVLPSLMEHRVYADGKPAWLRLGFQDDPWAVENDKKDSEGRTPQVAYVTEKFKSTPAAKKAISAMPTYDEESADHPSGYDAETWAGFRDEIVGMLEEGQSSAEVAEAYEVGVKWIDAIAEDVAPV